MKVRFRTNLGSRDAAQLGVDYTKCTAGAEVDVSEKAAESLQSRGIAEILSKKKEVKAVPEKPAIAEAKKPTITSDEKKSDRDQ